MLTLRDVRVDYSGVVAVAGVDLDLQAGEAVALIGANGAGKSSLLQAICGLHRPIGGSIEFLGTTISRLPAHRITPLGLALVPEGRRLFGELSVRKNLMLGAYGRKAKAERDADLDYVIELMPILGERLDQRAATMSGGQQQMVALGRALMSRPQLLMLDEPSLGIAPNIVARIFDALQVIRDRGTTILLVEQNLRLALDFADRAYALQSGRVVMAGSSDDMAGSDDVRRAYLGV